jgi:hypothetical protein
MYIKKIIQYKLLYLHSSLTSIINNSFVEHNVFSLAPLVHVAEILA